LLEPLDCCVSPVLTAAEAAQHPLFNPETETDSEAQTSASESPDEAGGLPQ